ncbi:hypothetical protein [Nocardioides daphniae]|uniref:Carboxypeptidase regulatory-like domain-containing protein n=1 Tax=Nocardioides daphniae TaxID=402297 RepID=A0A4P7U7W2_9ACTN|nr:hypothetical protein [Nocardioides daphniae]QCC76170.1 hypothetical protein E2C04_01260 [Nocardioides daphniae]GGD09389.1 hypothetical protein GCM10007231_05320 [Nocardioides daphniae]
MRWRSGAAAAVMVMTWGALTGCGGDGETAGRSPEVVTGQVVDGPGGAPVPGAEVELVLHPAVGVGGEQAAEETAASDVADSKGRFALAAPVEELTLNAAPDGRVQVELRVKGSEAAGTMATVLLRKDAETGRTEVTTTSDVVVVSPAS